ncbi:MAG: PCRF domain-containing protein [Patescibacteria group bacterium]|nr:PCRF domain-containing protein [Patescibacteria group bacterium]
MKPADLAGGFDLEAKRGRIEELEAEMAAPAFWQDREAADVKIREHGELSELVKQYAELQDGLATLEQQYDENKFHELKKQFREFELSQLFTGPYDAQAAVLTVYPGVGGEDAEDWARMLGVMYENYAKRRGWKLRVVDDNPRSRAVEIQGAHAYGYLKKESGVHRLVRISPFDAKKARHTSFALVEVIPDLPPLEESKLEIPEKDLKFEFSRAGGPGGQNVNKVETAVRVIHLPTGLAVGSRTQRSQQQNREYALKLLKAKLFQLMEKEKVDEVSKLRAKVKPEWGNQIRSYVLNPYQMVKDHRTEAETARVDEVLMGDLDIFIEAELENLSSRA